MAFIEIDGRKLFYQWGGKFEAGRPTFVLLNGLVNDSRTFEQYYGKLIASGHAVLQIDHTSRGQSDWIEHALDFRQMHDEIRGVVEALGVDRPVWIAASAAAGMACELAVTLPSAGVVLEAPVFPYRNKARIELLNAVLGRDFADPTLEAAAHTIGLLALSSGFLEKNPHIIMGLLMVARRLFTIEQFRRAWDQLINSCHGDPELMSRIACPVLVLYGTEERLQPRHLIDELFARHPSTRVEVFDAAHYIVTEQPDAMFAAMVEFIEKLETPAAGRAGGLAGRA